MLKPLFFLESIARLSCLRYLWSCTGYGCLFFTVACNYYTIFLV